MGCCYSRLEREETVSRCKARKRYMKQLVKARQAFSASHSLYIRSLRGTGAALRQFSNAETYIRRPQQQQQQQNYHHHLPPVLPSPTPRTPPPPPPPHIPMSPSSDTWTSITASPALPPPPPPPPSSTWDFWDPFVPSTSRTVTEEEWEATTIASEAIVTVTGAASSAPPPSVVSGFSKDTSSTELAMVVSRNTKDLVEIIKELDEYFLKAADAGAQLSLLLEVPTFSPQNKGGKSSAEPTSEIHRQSTLQLELEVQQWHASFCNLVKAQRDYVQSLTGWLRLCLFQISGNPLLRTGQDSRIYSLCEEWNLAVDRIPDKVASEGIKSFLTVVHAIVVQQAEEYRQKKKADSASKELDKRASELRSLESKYVSHSMRECSASTRGRDPVQEKQNKVENLRTKARDEKQKHENLVSVTRSMTINNLQMSFPHVFQAMVGFSSVCMHAYEAVYNQTKNTDQHEVKRLLP